MTEDILSPTDATIKDFYMNVIGLDDLEDEDIMAVFTLYNETSFVQLQSLYNDVLQYYYNENLNHNYDLPHHILQQ